MAQELAQDRWLRSRMSAAGISSYRALAAKAEVSRWQVSQLRGENRTQMRLEILSRFAAALQIPLASLLQDLGLLEATSQASNQSTKQELAALQQEYARLQGQVEQKREEARSHIKTEALQILESWLVQWPTIAKRASDNEDLKAVKVLPFVHPVEQLMNEWGVEAIAPVDAEVEYDPQIHQLVGGIANTGDIVRVTHSGSRYEGKLLHRAKVKPL